MELKKYQIDAISVCKESKRKLIHLPPGSGKSLIFYNLIQGYPVLLVAPNYVLEQHKQYFIDHNIPYSEHPHYTQDSILLVSPARLRLSIDTLKGIQYKLICFDESHILKNLNSKTTKAAIKISLLNPEAVKLCMTATPCPETLGELYPQIYIVNPGTPLGHKPDFLRNYTRKELVGGYWKTVYINTNRLMKLAKPDIFSDPTVTMPDQVIKDIALTMPPDLAAIYEQAKSECHIMIEQKPLFFTAGLWMKLSQICSGFASDGTDTYIINQHKINTIKELVSDLDDQCIIWSNFIFDLDQLHKAIPDSNLIKGGTKNGPDLVTQFKQGKYKVLIANPLCIGAGVSFECCHYQIFSSISASGGLYTQTRTRTNRLSQMSQEILYRVFYRKTIMDALFHRVPRKGETELECMRDIILKGK